MQRTSLGATISPTAVFSPGLSPRDAVWPLLAVTVADVVISNLTRPFLVQAVTSAIPVVMRARVEAQLDSHLHLLVAGALVRPVLWCLMWASLVYLFLGVCGHIARFGRVFAAIACAYVILALKDIASYAMLAARGVETMTGPADLEIGWGLGFLIAGNYAPLRVAADSVNLFDACFLVIGVVGVRRTETVSESVATVAVLGAWLVVVCGRVLWAVLF